MKIQTVNQFQSSQTKSNQTNTKSNQTNTKSNKAFFSTPTFGAYRNQVLKQLDPLSTDLFVSHRNDTGCFRDNEFWQNCIDYLSKKSKNHENMNVYFYGCSVGSEPCTFLMQLLTSGSEDLIRKFSKIIAKDFDPHVIDMAKSGVLPIQAYEVEKIQKFTNGRFRKFFPTAPKPIQFIGKQNIDIQFDKELNKKIDYSVADITTDFKTIEPEGSMVFARNFLPYLRTRKTVVELVKNLGEHLKKGSNLAVGNFDHRGLSIHRINLNELLEVAGFNKTKIENLYEKV